MHVLMIKLYTKISKPGIKTTNYCDELSRVYLFCLLTYFGLLDRVRSRPVKIYIDKRPSLLVNNHLNHESRS